WYSNTIAQQKSPKPTLLISDRQVKMPGRNGVCSFVSRVFCFLLSKCLAKSPSMLVPSEVESDVVIVRTNHGLVFSVPVPPQSFEEKRSCSHAQLPARSDCGSVEVARPVKPRSQPATRC